MRFTYLSLVAMVGMGLLLGCQPAAEEPSEPAAPEEAAMSDEELLEAQTDAFEAAWGEADAAGLAALFIEEGDTVGPEGARFHGRAAIQGRYENLLGGIYQGTSVTIATTSMTFPSPDTAIVHGSYAIHGMKNADGEDMEVNGLFMNVAVKDNAEWKIHCSRVMVPLPAPDPGT